MSATATGATAEVAGVRYDGFSCEGSVVDDFGPRAEDIHGIDERSLTSLVDVTRSSRGPSCSGAEHRSTTSRQ